MDWTVYASRKFILAAAAILLPSALIWLGKLDSGSYTAIVLGALGLYSGANVAQRHQAFQGPQDGK
jgi:hypothetical protein